MYFSTEWVSGCKCFLSSGEKWQHSNGIDWCLVFIYFKQNNNFTKLYTLYTHSITELWRLMKKDIPSRRSFNFILNWSSLHWSMTCAARQDIEYYEPFLFLQLFFFFAGSANRSVIFNNLLLFPTPIITPGTLYISMSGNITRDLPRKLSIQLTVHKYWIGIPFMLPCFNNQIGSW